MMVVRANAMTYNAPSPQLAQMLLDLLNKRITPVVQSRGTLGEGDLAQLGNVAATMVGAGEAYYQGARMPAAEALAQAGLKPIQPFAADDNALTSSDAYATGMRHLRSTMRERALEWADLIYAMDLNGMNSSITPLSTRRAVRSAVQWLNWDAARVLDMIKGSYLFERRSARIIQDPGEPARVVHPPGLGLGGLGRAERRGGAADQLIGSQSRRCAPIWRRRIRGSSPPRR